MKKRSRVDDQDSAARALLSRMVVQALLWLLGNLPSWLPSKCSRMISSLRASGVDRQAVSMPGGDEVLADRAVVPIELPGNGRDVVGFFPGSQALAGFVGTELLGGTGSGAVRGARSQFRAWSMIFARL
ncbi:hypothetical protein [Mycolicibacterium agri]|uniref:hypothetical protein n=1 Tax=Mycolicibacterium agri TaxID=36811 RepID=UPI001056700A|nr:hypothetical protein [Mycolicibacterium agri]